MDNDMTCSLHETNTMMKWTNPHNLIKFKSNVFSINIS